MFIDKSNIMVRSGNGGNGSISFRREKYIPLGGPDGGDGGAGGDVTIKVNSQITTLLDFKYNRRFIAEDGKNGQGSKCYGRDGKDLVIEVPMGTIIRETESNKIITDLAHDGDKIVICAGGRGGRGNVKFCTSTRQAPGFSEPGMPCEEMEITLELKLLADVGLLGFPNVGKSTLLSVVTKAKPKIANYHFTTLKPNLGVVATKGITPFVMADIPGIIEGASEGVGLGFEFLRHIERTRLLVHIVDISGVEGRDPVADFKKINEELRNYSVKLWDRPQIVVANKSDMLFDDEVYLNFEKEVRAMGFESVFKMSAATNQGVEEVMKEMARVLATIPVKDLYIEEDERYIPKHKKFTYEITKLNENGQIVYSLEGSFVDRLLMSSYINDPDSLRHLHRVLTEKGVFTELRELGIEDEDIVRLKDYEFEYLM
ncbi:GTPase ObgE [uncultured Clostridium sp.]|jgi:GTP-binding protein|uniref:GTPase ObgE n=1 Tax=uncultured Clostridium sp. TaxID=59620 RepID=UPI0026240FDF|nr:GTPase ObgE [uncultured Clostridium sp.]